MTRSPHHGIVVAAALAITAAGAAAQWEELGPAPISSGPYTGRVAAIACSPTDPDLYYVGGADGGVWRTDDGGASWRAVGDSLPTTAIGALALDPDDHQVVYAGTGEANFANHSRYGVGLARSRDGGQSWRMLGAATFGGRCFSRIRVDPDDPSILYASVTHAGGFPARVAARGHPLAQGPLGIFKSTDYGDTWTQLDGGLPTTVSATDVMIDPDNPSVVYAAIGDIFGDNRNGVYKSTDGGQSFSKLGAGLPTTDVGRVTLALAPSQPRTLYAAVVAQSSSSGGGASTRGVYRSDNAGASWRSINAPSYHATYGWFLSTAVVGPQDPNLILLGGFTCERSTNGGTSWRTVTPPHVDLHALEFDAAGRLLCGNDGGIHRSADNGSSWQSINNNLGTIQFYAGISLHPTNPGLIFAGAQDNGTVQRNSGTGWINVLGGDGGYTSMDSTGSRVFAEYQGTGNLFRSINGGPFLFAGIGIFGRNCFLPPHEVHPRDPMQMIYGTERVFTSSNGGSSWQASSPDLTGGGGAAISGLAWAPSDSRVMYAFTNDGRVQSSTDAGSSWQLRLTGLPTWPRTTRPFAVHPYAPETVYLAVAGFGAAKLMCSEDAGRNWVRLDGDLPDLPAHAVALDVATADAPILYLGTDQGVWRSEDHGTRWRRYGADLPNAPVVDLRVDGARRRLAAATQGRGIWVVRLLPRGQVFPNAHAK